MPRNTLSGHGTSWPGSRQHHAHRGSKVSEFGQRAATAWIRAADAGVIDATELDWLLGKLSELQGQDRGVTGPSSGQVAGNSG